VKAGLNQILNVILITITLLMINLMQLIKELGAATMASLMYLIDQNGIETKE
jgi:hypothetical protein